MHFAAEISLILDELDPELLLVRHIQGVLYFESEALSRLSPGATVRQRHMSLNAVKDDQVFNVESHAPLLKQSSFIHWSRGNALTFS